jgi:hypothetical protein
VGTDKVVIMRRRRWVIDTFLWTCPVAGMGVFVFRFLAGTAPPAQGAWDFEKFFDVPGVGSFSVLVGAMVVPLVVAFATRRTLGFFAGASVFLGLVVGAVWWRSHRGTSLIEFARCKAGEADVTTDRWSVSIQDGGISVAALRSRPAKDVGDFRGAYLAPGRDQSIRCWEIPGSDSYPSMNGFYSGTPRNLRRLGFAGILSPPPAVDLGPGGFCVALALPCWFLCLVAIPLPVAWAVRFRRRRRFARRALAGQCVGCGYDLRATPDPGGARLAVCPECGAGADAGGKGTRAGLHE